MYGATAVYVRDELYKKGREFCHTMDSAYMELKISKDKINNHIYDLMKNTDIGFQITKCGENRWTKCPYTDSLILFDVKKNNISDEMIKVAQAVTLLLHL